MCFQACSAFGDSPEGDVFRNIHRNLAAGKRAGRADVDAVTAELVHDPSNPYKRMVAGEALAGLGLQSLAAEQFEAADKVQKDYILKRFKEALDANPFIPPLLFPYLQDKYRQPQDPAVLYFAARRQLRFADSIRRAKDEQKMALDTARKELSMAAAMPDWWRGTLATLALLEYNEGARLPAGSAQNALIDAAIRDAGRELERHPDEPMAHKVRLLALCRKGSKPWELMPYLQRALAISPLDPQLNLLYGRACSYNNSGKAAVRPALIGLLYAEDPATISDARSQVYDLIRSTKKEELLPEIDAVIKEGLSYAGIIKATMMRIRLSELFGMAGSGKEACHQLEIAANMHPVFRTIVAFRLARLLAAMHDYKGALHYSEIAYLWNKNPAEEYQIASFHERMKQEAANSKRDLALYVKKSLFPAK